MLDHGTSFCEGPSRSSPDQDTGFSAQMKDSISSWVRQQSFKVVVSARRYELQQQILKDTADSENIRGPRHIDPDCSPSLVSRTRRLFSMDREGSLFYHGRPAKGPLRVIPEDTIIDTIEHEHNAIHHQGTRKTWYEISNRYHGIPKRVVDYAIRQCELCHSQESSARPAPVQAVISERVMERVQMDMIDMQRQPDNEYHWILHIKDHFSRFCMLYPLINGDQQEVIQCLMEWMAILGPPGTLQMDNGAPFVSEAIMRVAEEHHIHIRHGSAGRPRSQGLVERANGHVRRLIAKWCKRFGERHWAKSLPSIAMTCNMTIHSTIGRSPFEVVFSRRPVLNRTISGTSMQSATDSDSQPPNGVNQSATADIDDDQPHMFGSSLAHDMQAILSASTSGTGNLSSSDAKVDDHYENGSSSCWVASSAPHVSIPGSVSSETLLHKQVRVHVAKEQDRMVKAWEKRHNQSPLELGAHVSTAVHGIDRGPLDDYRIPCIVVDFRRNRGYRVCTELGVLKRRIPIRHVIRLPPSHQLPEQTLQYAADWRSAPRISLKRYLRKVRKQ